MTDLTMSPDSPESRLARLDQKVMDMADHLNRRIDDIEGDVKGMRREFQDFRDELRSRDEQRTVDEQKRERDRIERAEMLQREDVKERRKIRWTFAGTVAVALLALLTAILTQGIHL